MTLSTNIELSGGRVPRLIYGTAWKEEETEPLTALALRQGFRGIDTANQRKHYYEEGVGRALADALAQGIVARDDLFVQTKFTFAAGQDYRLPYDPAAAIETQVRQSLASSQEHLRREAIDSFVLHGPTTHHGLAAADWEAWRAMEALHQEGKVLHLGVSNVSLPQLQSLFSEARVAPSFVQNRCYAVRGWDRAIRAFCRDNGAVYQGFSLLTANRQVLAHEAVVRIAGRYDGTPAQVVVAFALAVGMIVLTGTTSAVHMQHDLDALALPLTPAEIEQIEALAG
jgi:diketogulonate reductase-like aldo/keto reductase